MGITNLGTIIYCVGDEQRSFNCDFDSFDLEKLKDKEKEELEIGLDVLMLHVVELVEVHMKPRQGKVYDIRLQKNDRLIAYADNLREGTKFKLL